MSKFYHTNIAVGLLLTATLLSGCGQKGALYLPNTSNQSVVNPIAKPATDGTNNAFDPQVNPNTQDPNITLDKDSNQATTSAVGGKNDY